MQVKSIAECSLAFCGTFDLHQDTLFRLKELCFVYFQWLLKTCFTVVFISLASDASLASATVC